MSTICHSLLDLGSTGIVIDIECHLSNNLPTIVIVGFASKAVNEAKDRLRGAFASSQLTLPRRRITINLAPADIPKTDSGHDMAMAISILAASEQIMPLPDTAAAIGELGLDGAIRTVRGIIGKIVAGRNAGITSFYIPAGNLAQAQLVPGVTLYPVSSLQELHSHLSGKHDVQSVVTRDGIHNPDPTVQPKELTLLSSVVGQDIAKRALTIAAAGGHNILLSGPPGTGKSMLAHALTSLLPPLSYEEILEVTHLNSLASSKYDQLFTQRPLRKPHHSTSHVAMIGGGLRPGEISLSHRGVLLLDEFPEFSRDTLESLRQPMEDHSIQIVRAKNSAEYPANFILVATANPCPCGYNGTNLRACICLPAQLLRYQSKISGPIMDRIDLCCDVHEVDHKQLLKPPAAGNDNAVRSSIAKARRRQAARYNSAVKLNSDLTNAELRNHASLSKSATTMLNTAAKQLGLSARGYLRIVKVARTIADLEAASAIQVSHINEAIAYRQRPAGNTPV